MADESKSGKLSASQTLFPISGAEKGARVATSGFLFPCVPSNEENRAADIGTNHPNWLRNDSYKDVKCSKTEQTEQADEYQLGSAEKRSHVVFSSSDEERELEHHSKKRLHHKEKKKSKQKKKQKHKHEDSKLRKKSNEDLSKPNTIWIEEALLTPEKAFRVHKKPDLENRRYDTLYRLDIAMYKVRSRVTCLGLGKHQVVELSEKKSKKKKKNQEVARYWNTQNLRTEEVTKEVTPAQARLGKTEQLIGSNDSSFYVPLKIPQEHQVKLEERYGEVKDQSDLEVNSQEVEVLERTAQLNKTLRENPQDVETWLALVNFQEETISRGQSVDSGLSATGRETRKAATRVIIEKKIAVYEKALEQNPTSVELIVGHLDLCGEIMDTDQLVQKWKKVSFVHPNNTLLWKHYLLFTQSRFSVFSFSRAARVYDKCLSTLSSIKEGTFASHQTTENDMESKMLDFFIQECQFAKQSGHTEKAVASFQAMIELNCFCSPDLEKNTPVSGQVAFLETFWDSGQPRFGEEGAVGWKSWMSKEHSISSPLVPDLAVDIKKIFKAGSTNPPLTEESSSLGDGDDEVAVQKNQPLWKNWLNVERFRGRTQLKPWQPDKEAEQTEDDCDDPERLVVFEDISSSLFKIVEPANKLKLVLSFLEFFGVPVPCRSPTTSSEVQRFLNSSIEHKAQLSGARNPPSSPPTSQFLGLWQSYQWSNNPCESDGTNQCWPSSEALSCIRIIFVQCGSMFEGAERSFLVMLWLWFEFCLSQTGLTSKESKQKYKDVRRLSKTLLKQPQNRNDLKLWQTYAEMEWCSGNISDAHKVFNTALVMCTEMFSDEEDRRAALAPLVRSYAELELGVTTASPQERQRPPPPKSEGNQKALQILTIFAEGAQFGLLNSPSLPEVSAVRLLKSRKTYQKWHRDVLESIDAKRVPVLQQDCTIATGSMVVQHEACCALFEYLTAGIQGVLLMLNELVSVISCTAGSPNEMDSELISTCYIRLLKFYLENGGTLPLKDTRKALHFVLERFPDNPEFLSFYIQREAKSNLTGEIRRTLDKAAQKATTPVPWIFAIHFEQLRSESLVSVPSVLHSEENSSVTLPSLPVTGVIHRQRSLFDRAVSTSSRHCVALWRMFMDFELKNGKDKVKSVFYQALQNCPWAKVLYMDAVQYLPDELQDIVDLMTEKEIRLRAPLEEIELLLQE